jgi:Protein of unknown function (DUF3237)
MNPSLSHLMDLRVDVGAPVIISGESQGRRFIPILGGLVEGGLEGRVMSGGGDWQTVAPDGTLDIDAHYVLAIRDHGMVEVRSRGLRSGSASVLAALGRGEEVDPSEYYFRTSIRLRTAAPGLARLNQVIALSTGARVAGGVRLKVFEVG